MDKQPKITLEAFGWCHGLRIEVKERLTYKQDNLSKYFAHFVGSLGHSVGIKEGECCTAYPSGNGNTPKQAISNYAKSIAGQLIKFDSGLLVPCPPVWYTENNGRLTKLR